MIETAQKITIVVLLAVAAGFDAARGIIPNKLIMAGFAALAVLMAARASPGAVVFALLGFLAGGVPLLIIILVTKGGMGAGDMKLMAMTGAYIGPILAGVTLCAAVIMAGVYAVFTLALRVKTLKSRMAFGPFIAAAGILTVALA